MTPAMQQYLRLKAFKYNVFNANTLELTNEMKHWSESDWVSFAAKQNADHIGESFRAAEARERELRRQQDVSYFCEVCDRQTAEKLADGGVDAFYEMRESLTFEQFTQIGWYMFRSAAYC